MEGPTPVSALIHAATMVTAGVYMVARMNPSLHALRRRPPRSSPSSGALTAVFAATMALTQNDIKRVLAYSTISQIGYMFIGCGVGAYAAGMFHLYTHAFFKSLLFLAAGSVMHALSGEQDMRKMGGLRKYLPRTFPAFPHRSDRHRRRSLFLGLFLQGRHPDPGLRRRPVFRLGARPHGRGADRVLHVPSDLPRLSSARSGSTPHARAHLHESPQVMTVPLGHPGVLLGRRRLRRPARGSRREGRPLPAASSSPSSRPRREVDLSRRGRMASHPDFGRGRRCSESSSPTSSICKKPRSPHALVARFPWLYKLLYQ